MSSSIEGPHGTLTAKNITLWLKKKARCEACFVGDLRCENNATKTRAGRSVCRGHARANVVRWFDAEAQA